MIHALRHHWPEYVSEALLLGLFMVSACGFTILLFHPVSPVVGAVPDPFVRRMLVGLAMGVTALALIFSPPGQLSGAHMNPAITITFWRLGKIDGVDAVFYVIFQFLGAVAGVGLVGLVAGKLLAHESVNYVATVPGPWGPWVAFLAEFVIAFGMMLTVLGTSNHAVLAKYTPYFAATLVVTYITFEAPISGMSINPARSFGSAAVGSVWKAAWVYFSAPLAGMLTAAAVFVGGGRVVYCAKLHHHNNARCIFHCAYHELTGGASDGKGAGGGTGEAGAARRETDRP